MSGLFCIANLLEVGRKKKTILKYFMDFNPPNQNETKYSHNKCLGKSAFTEMTSKLAKNRKTKKK